MLDADGWMRASGELDDGDEFSDYCWWSREAPPLLTEYLACELAGTCEESIADCVLGDCCFIAFRAFHGGAGSTTEPCRGEGAQR